MRKRIYDDEFELFSDLENDLTTSMLTSVDRKVRKVYKRNVENTPKHTQHLSLIHI